jgi:aminoglycoside 3-N-acetyltransferase I
MEHTYQQISAADLPLLKSLLAVFGEAFDEPDTYQGAVPIDAYLESLLRKPHFIALAALPRAAR